MSVDLAAWRRRWDAAEMPSALFEAAQALVWALEAEDDLLTWSVAIASLLDRREGSTRTPLDLEHLKDRLSVVCTDNELEALARALSAARSGSRPTPWVPVSATTPEARAPAAPWLEAEGALVSRRLWVWESRVHAWLREARADAPSTPDHPSLDAPDLTDEQRAAVRLASSGRLAAMTGGPGTGKTTVIARLIGGLRERGTPSEAITLVAPTGKAAQRLQEALRSTALTDPPVAETLHRALGYRPATDTFAAGPDHPLDSRVVIVDEASMVDLRTMERLVSALAPTARLILVGDAEQLPSVEAGAVFRDIVEGAPERVARLTKNLRVVESEGGRALITFAERLRRGEARLPEPQPELPAPDAEGVFFVPLSGDPRVDRKLWARWLELEREAPTDAPPSSKILTVVREGASGSEAVNRELASRRAARSGELGWSVGQPVMVTKNLYARPLFNGDIGVVAPGAGSGRRAVVFADGANTRAFDLSTLRDHLVGADALTVHKSQGSEFDRVLVHLPPEAHPLLSRELIYTAVTRARRQVVIAGRAEVFDRGQRRRIRRRTGTYAP